MAALMLTAPIRIKPAGSDTIRDVVTIHDANEILIDWPQARRGPFYQAAREQVQAALDGKATAAQAQEAFAALCDHAGILVR
ncbi:DUF982 domain-containing protein [Mesorhizobium sp. ES1-1]|uniref:DUF982 domain-containing protein n=1 Tax=Mesorhizobium sp. ES1-1 TaxID=2876629 RepID=UPI001CCFE0CA|nr:DUF982 domain-containing protein [Mesorhizobium sp. ES1-1]MBZ9675700.1 DUF982 domain-containing protein [Mesorhizobium sp. ES1-1]